MASPSFVLKRRSASENEKWKWTRTKGTLATKKGERQEEKRMRTQNEGEGRIGPMLYNGSDSLSILSPADNLVMQPLRDLVRELQVLLFSRVCPRDYIVAR